VDASSGLSRLLSRDVTGILARAMRLVVTDGTGTTGPNRRQDWDGRGGRRAVARVVCRVCTAEMSVGNHIAIAVFIENGKYGAVRPPIAAEIVAAA